MADPRLAVIFDLDGLLVDTEPVWGRSGDLVLAPFGHSWDRSLRPRVMGRSPRTVASVMVEHYGLDIAPEQLAARRLELQRQLYREAGVQLLPGARLLVEALVAADMPRAVASGSPTDLAEATLEGSGLRSFFDVCLGSDLVARGKPAPDIFRLAARHLDVEPADCVVLEDADSGVAAALAAGKICVKVAGVAGSGAAGAHLHLPSLEKVDLSLLQGLVATRGRASIKEVQDDRP